MRKLQPRIEISELLPLITFFVSILIPLPFILRTYAWADDWSFLYEYNFHERHIEHLSGLRPLLQLIFDITFPFASSHETLFLLRLIGVIGCSLISLTSYKFFVRNGFGTFFGLSIALLLGLLPSFQIYIKWATAFPYTWACLFSLWGTIFWLKDKFLAATLFTLVAFFIYQPAGVFGSALLFALILNGTWGVPLKKFFIWIIIVFASSQMLAIILNKVLGIGLKSRASLIHTPEDIFLKIIWILTRPTTLSSRIFLVDSPGVIYSALSLIPYLIAVLSLLKIHYKNYFRSVSGFLQLTVLFLTALLPVLVIEENQIEFRILPGTSFIGLIILVSSLNQLIKRKQVKYLALSILMFSVVIYSNNWSNKVFFESYTNESNFIRSSMANIDNHGGLLNYRITYEDWPQRQWIGSLSAISDLQMEWVLPGMIYFETGKKFYVVRSNNLNDLVTFDFDKYRIQLMSVK